MAVDRIILDGITFGAGGTRTGPSNVDEDIETFGSETVSRNGSLTLLQTGQKQRWTITWDKVDKTTRDSVRSLAKLARTFSFTDPDGTVFTVQCPKSGRYKSGIAILGSTGGGTLYYGVTLVIWET